MRRGFFARLACINIKKNKSTYIPYMITCIICIAMTYMMFYIVNYPNLENIVQGGSDVKIIMKLGIIVICIFSFIFLVYSNSFLMKRRNKELGLYSILGMEKGHISKILFLETVFTTMLSVAGGILTGIIGSKLALLLLLKLLHVPAQFGFYVSVKGIFICLVIFGVVFLFTLLNNMRKVRLSQPIELLRGSSVGEREPKAKRLIALLGFICLGSGYYIAVTTESPLSALMLFFVAVLLVMAGTYLVFTAGSIVVLKMMRWKKSFYYKMKNFTSVSGMLYRMKQNAVGLASICILSTGVLLMLSSTVSLNFGMEDVMQSRYPYDVNFTFRDVTTEEAGVLRDAFDQAMKEEGISAKEVVSQMTEMMMCTVKDDQILFQEPTAINEFDFGYLTLMEKSEYERLTQTDTGLSDGEVFLYTDSKQFGDEIGIQGNAYQVKQRLNEWPAKDADGSIYQSLYIVLTEADFAKLDQLQKDIYKEYQGKPMLDFGVDIEGGKQEQLAEGQKLRANLQERMDAGIVSEDVTMQGEIREENYQTFYVANGGLLFLGIFLGTLFLVGTAMIIYYKQMSEGYEDKQRFEIMQKVGMSRKEVKSSIHRQILMVFFLPLLMAVLHIIMAFPLIRRLLMLLGMMNTQLYVWCTLGTILIFGLVYAVIYAITAKSYFKIVEW